jgi:hypothetical protein
MPRKLGCHRLSRQASASFPVLPDPGLEMPQSACSRNCGVLTCEYWDIIMYIYIFEIYIYIYSSTYCNIYIHMDSLVYVLV